MLRLSKITKNYVVADSSVKALKGIDLSFRKNEFVSVLGPSGCGKTTLLNIIGGLDKYTSGDLFINGRSTKEFKDRDWDIYRNHRVGFIFQSYNLIPHQSILSNVELALTIAGVGKAERSKRAKAALDKVGLKGQYSKKPNQLSGGQCQRVAIARALVNDPEILLADEPTGALDTGTSVQIMELIKEIAKDRLVIMVTHNPDLAEEYSTRIIKLLDGKIVDDSNPFSAEDEKSEVEEIKKATKKLLKDEEANLSEEIKKLQNRLEKVEKTDKNEQKEIKKQLKASKKALNNNLKRQKSEGYVKTSGKKARGRTTNETAKMSFWTAFKLSIQSLFTKKGRTILTSIAGAIGIIGVSLVLSISCGVKTYIRDMQDDMLSGNPITISQSALDLSAMMQASTMTDRVHAIKENGLVNVESIIEYLVSRSATADNFTVSNTITEDYMNFVKRAPSEHIQTVMFNYGLDVTNNIYTDFYDEGATEPRNISLSAIKNIYTSILGQTEYAKYSSLITSLGETFMQAPDDNDYILSQYNVISGDIAKGKDEIMIVVNEDRQLTDLLLAELGYYTQDEFMNIIWRETDDERYDENLDKTKFNYSELLGKKFTYFKNDTIFKRAQSPINPFTYDYLNDDFEGGMELKVVGILEPKDEISYGCLQRGFFYTDAFADYMIEDNIESELAKYIDALEGKSLPSGVRTIENVGLVYYGITYEYDFKYSYNSEAPDPNKKGRGYVGSSNTMLSLLSSAAGYLGGTMSFESYNLSLNNVGGTHIASEIYIYPLDFDNKSFVVDYLDKWNSDETLTIIDDDGNEKTLLATERDKITYADNISVIINMVNSLIDIVTYALVGFTALSLVVSCVMIAIITYVSVVERTKEIGVIRSLGGRKRDVSYLFNAETFIIGLGSGLIGIAVTYLLSGIANLIISSLTTVSRIAIFPWYYAVIMVTVSVVLTLISGLIPSRSAARRDPVVALRTE